MVGLVGADVDEEPCSICGAEATCNCAVCDRFFCEICHGIHCCEAETTADNDALIQELE